MTFYSSFPPFTQIFICFPQSSVTQCPSVSLCGHRLFSLVFHSRSLCCTTRSCQKLRCNRGSLSLCLLQNVHFFKPLRKQTANHMHTDSSFAHPQDILNPNGFFSPSPSLLRCFAALHWLDGLIYKHKHLSKVSLLFLREVRQSGDGAKLLTMSTVNAFWDTHLCCCLSSIKRWDSLSFLSDILRETQWGADDNEEW